MSIKLNDIDFFQNPYPLYAQLRQNYPCYFYTDWQCWLFSRYDDVNALLRHSSLARVLPGVSDVNLSPGLRMFNDLMSGALLDSVLAVHNKNRFFFTHLFVQNAINYLQPLIEVYANKLLHVLSDSDVIDMRLDFIAPLATYTIAEFLGMPQSDSQQLLCWSNSMLRVYEPDCSAQQMLDSLASLQSFIAYTQDIIRKRQQQPEADFISQCLRDSIEPGLIDLQTLTVNVIQIFNAGHSAIVDAFCNGLLALLRHPTQWQALLENQQLLPVAIDECLRYDTSLLFFRRWVTAPFKFAERDWQVGDQIGLLLGAANHDEAKFKNPEQFDITRHPNPHLSFGAGIHYCLGAPLAKMILRTALVSIQRYPKIHLASQPSYLNQYVFRGLTALPVRLAS